MISYRVPSFGILSISADVQRTVVLILSTSLSPGEAWFISLITKKQIALTRNHYALGLQIIIQRLGAVLSSKPARFHAAKRQLVVTVMQRVYPNISCLNPVDRRL